MDRIYLQVTAGNLRQNHLYVRDHLDFFPPDIVGPPRRNGNRDHEIVLHLDGLNRPSTVTSEATPPPTNAASFFCRGAAQE